MSHISRVSVSIANTDAIGASLQDMGLTLVRGATTIYADGEVNVDMYIKEKPTIGFKLNTDTREYDIVGDFWRTGLDEDVFPEELVQRYTGHLMTAQILAVGQRVADKQMCADDVLRIRVSVP